MSTRGQVSSTDSTGGTTLSRRSILATSGVVAFGGLGGCLTRVASVATNTDSSPAAVFAGERTDQFRLTTPKVNRLTPALSGESTVLSGEIELEGGQPLPEPGGRTTTTRGATGVPSPPPITPSPTRSWSGFTGIWRMTPSWPSGSQCVSPTRRFREVKFKAGAELSGQVN